MYTTDITAELLLVHRGRPAPWSWVVACCDRRRGDIQRAKIDPSDKRHLTLLAWSSSLKHRMGCDCVSLSVSSPAPKLLELGRRAILEMTYMAAPNVHFSPGPQRISSVQQASRGIYGTV